MNAEMGTRAWLKMYEMIASFDLVPQSNVEVRRLTPLSNCLTESAKQPICYFIGINALIDARNLCRPRNSTACISVKRLEPSSAQQITTFGRVGVQR